MKLHWISILVLLLAISSTQWGVSTGEELNRKASNNRLRRQLYNTDSSDINVGLYVVYSLISLCIYFAPCIIIWIIVCIVRAVNSSSRNAPTHVTTTQTIPNSQPSNYSYPQPVQTPAYYLPGPPATVKAQYDFRPPSYSTTQLDNPKPNIGFQTYH